MNIIAANALPASTDGLNTLAIANDADLNALAASGALQGVQRIELHFPAFTDGRAFSQAVLLRRRLGFTGDIRATGEVLIDQLVQMARSGFSSAVLAEGVDPAAAQRQFERYHGFYQGDALQPRPLFARQDAPQEKADEKAHALQGAA
ncbi:MAG: DUF934 domain-containing protein [Pseudomonadota bacterium]|nr:DUF934 domain-containing protein [Pseudomonadota bacterium]